MPDWKSYVRQRLGRTGLPRDCEQEIVRELASHLEDMEVSERRVEQQVPDWAALARDIRDAKEDYMQGRVRTFWVPGLAVDLLATFLMQGVQLAGVRPTVILTQPIPMVIYFPWLLMLPLLGALGAYWSRTVGGSPRMRWLVATFPCVVLAVLGSVSLIVNLVVALFVPEARTGFKFLTLAASEMAAVHVIAPAIALSIGALPFLRGDRGKRAAAPSDAAIAAQ